MPDTRRKTCRICGRHINEVGPLSWTGLCPDDSVAELTDNVHQMIGRRGPNFDKWRRSMAACVGGVLIDDVLPPA
jgi:hypothetical protein